MNDLDADYAEWLAAFEAWERPVHGRKSDPGPLSILLRSDRAVPKEVTQALGALIDPLRGSEVFHKCLVLVDRPADVGEFNMALALQHKLITEIISKEDAARAVGKEHRCSGRTVMKAWSRASRENPDLFPKLPRLEQRRAASRTKSLKKI